MRQVVSLVLCSGRTGTPVTNTVWCLRCQIANVIVWDLTLIPTSTVSELIWFLLSFHEFVPSGDPLESRAVRAVVLSMTEYTQHCKHCIAAAIMLLTEWGTNQYLLCDWVGSRSLCRLWLGQRCRPPASASNAAGLAAHRRSPLLSTDHHCSIQHIYTSYTTDPSLHSKFRSHSKCLI